MRASDFFRHGSFVMVGRVGSEPTTNGLKGRCSTTELPTRPNGAGETKQRLRLVQGRFSRRPGQGCVLIPPPSPRSIPSPHNGEVGRGSGRGFQKSARI